MTGPSLIEFIRQSIRSVWALELLLLIRRQPARAWSRRELVGELRASDAVVAGVLGRFETDGLVARDAEGRYRFTAKCNGLEGLCDSLAEAYKERPVVVINAIASQDDQLAAFADAFRLKDRDV
ncbi:MAG: hypothetical protein ACREEW_12835 [Caulobacteraceae bacterium]